MINLTKENIDKAIVNKGLNIVNLYQKGFIFTNETICTFNSLLIFRGLFNNKCKMLNSALEKLYYIADSLIPCIPDSGYNPDEGGGGEGGGGGQDVTKYYTVTVIPTPSNANVTINGISGKTASFPANTRVTIVAKLAGYYDKTATITALTEDTPVQITFTDADKIPTPTTYTVTIGTPYPANAKIYVNNTLYPIGSTLTVNPNTVLDVRATADGYSDYHDTITITGDYTISPRLESGTTYYTVAIGTPTPANAVVKINGVVKNPGDTMVVESGTVLVVTAEAEGYRLYQDNVTVIGNTPIEPVLQPIPEVNYTYRIVVRVGGQPINDATVVLTNQTTGVSVVASQISVAPNTSVSYNVSKQGYGTKTGNKIVISDGTIDYVDLVAEDNNVYVQIDAYKDTNVDADKRKVKVYYSALNDGNWTEIVNNVPQVITPGTEFAFCVIPVDDNDDPDLSNYKIEYYTYSAVQSAALRGTTRKEMICRQKGTDWMMRLYRANYNNQVIEDAKYWDGLNTEFNPFETILTPLGFYFEYYPNTQDYGRQVGITADNYDGVAYDCYSPNHTDVIMDGVLTPKTGNYMVVTPLRKSPLYENLYSSVNGTKVYLSPVEVSRYDAKLSAYIFVAGNRINGKTPRAKAGIEGNHVPLHPTDGTVPLVITFDANNKDAFDRAIGKIVATEPDSKCGPHYYRIDFDISSDNYEPGLEITATFDDGYVTKDLIFVIPTIAALENFYRIFDDDTHERITYDPMSTEDRHFKITNGKTGTDLSGNSCVVEDYPLCFEAPGYHGVYLDHPTERDIYLEPDSNPYLIVKDVLSDNNPEYAQSNPYETDFVVRLTDTGYWDMGHEHWLAHINASLFIASSANYGKTRRTIDGSVPPYYNYDPNNIQVTFNSNKARLVANTTDQANGITYVYVGPYLFPVTFDIDENNYVGGEEIICTIDDGVLTRTITFIIPIIPAYENQ